MGDTKMLIETRHGVSIVKVLRKMTFGYEVGNV